MSDGSNEDVDILGPGVPAAPVVSPSSEAASNVTANSATLAASVDPEGADTQYYFEYVDAADYDPSASNPYSAGSASPAPPGTDIGSSFNVQPASTNISGLAQSTTYHFRLVASNSLGTTDGTDQTFTTLTPGAPLIDSESSGNVTATAAVLTAEVNPNGTDTTYYFEYVDDADYNPSAPDPYSAGTQIPLPPGTDIGNGTADQSATVNVSGLTQDTTYHYRVVAINSVSTTDGTDQTVTTASQLAPSVDSESVNVGADSAMVNAQINPNYADSAYYFEYVDAADYAPGATDPYSAGSKAPAPPGNDIGSTNSDETASVNIVGLTPGTTYHYRVVAVNAMGTTYGLDQTFTTYVVLTAPAENVTQTSATLTAALKPNGSDMIYDFEYGTGTSYGRRAPLSDVDVGSGSSVLKVSQAISGLVANQTYHYRVAVSTDGGTTYFYGAGETFTTLPDPPIVGTGSASAAAAAAVALSGTVDPNGAATAYHFEYGPTRSYGSSTAEGSAGSDSGAVPVNAVTRALVPGTVYHFRLVATNAGGPSYGDDQTFVTAVTAARGVGPPAPGSLGMRAPIGRLVLNRVAEVKSGVAHVVASCKGGRGATCVGELAMTVREPVIKRVDGKRERVLESSTIGRIGFDILGGARATLDVKLHAAARKLLEQKHKLLRVTATATQHGRRSTNTIELRVGNG